MRNTDQFSPKAPAINCVCHFKGPGEAENCHRDYYGSLHTYDLRGNRINSCVCSCHVTNVVSDLRIGPVGDEER